MAEFIIAMLVHTPVWVYLLFIFLLSRGLSARKPASVTLERMAIIPAIFLIWDICDLLLYRDQTVANYSLWLVGLLGGTALGYILIKRTAATRTAAARTLHRQPDYTALPFMMLAFAVKYALGVINARAPETLAQPSVSAFVIIAGGFFAGVFIGKFTRYLTIYLSGELRAVR